MDAEETYERIQTMSTAADVEDFIESADVEWKPLGGRDNNVGIVRSGSDPAQALAERLTNGIDAVLERAVQESGTGVDSPKSPRKAVEDLFNLSGAGYNDMSKTWVRETAKANLRVMMDEGSDGKHPTIEIQDSGIGQRPADFTETFLSLNEDSKITKPYLIGKYGQGGSNTFDFCEYAIITSRHFAGGDIGWSIVRFNPRLDEEEEYSDGVFEYCVIDGEVPSIPEKYADDWSGSRVRLIDYDASDFNNILGPGRGSLYTVAHEAMFGSLFPFIIHDRRLGRFESDDYSKEKGGRRRTVVGSRYRLDQPAKAVDESREFKQVVVDGLGSIQVRYWVLEDTDDVGQFANDTHPIVLTLHGQNHHEEPKRTLKRTDYNFLKDRLIVEVDCEELSREGKRIFSSTRDRATKGEEYNKVKETLIQALKEDKKLQRLNKEYKQKALSESTNEQEERAKDLLADLLQEPESTDDGEAVTDGGPDDGSGGEEGGGGSREPVEPRHEYPTFVEIDNAGDPIEVKQGRVLRLRLKMDAEAKFDKLDRGEISVHFSDELDELVSYRSETTLDEGWKTFQYQVDDGAEIGTEGEIEAVVEWEEGKLNDIRDAEVVEPPEGSGGKKAVLQAPEIRQVSKDDTEVRETLGWTEDDDVVEYVPEEGDDTVFVAMYNEGIQPIRETLETDKTVQQYDTQYAAYISYWEIMRTKEADEEGLDPGDEYVHQEKNRTAKMLMRSISERMSPEALGII